VRIEYNHDRSTRAVSCGYIIAGGATNSGTSGRKKTRDVSYYDIPSDTWTHLGNMTKGLNTPVCDIDFVNNYLYCETGVKTGSFSQRIRIEL
jgi:hypothetical protein